MADDLDLLEKRLKLVAWIVGGLFAFVLSIGAPTLVAAWLGLPEPLVKAALAAALLVFAIAFILNWERVGAGAEPAGSASREKFTRLRESLAAWRDAEDFYAKALGRFLGWVDRFFDIGWIEKITKQAPTPTQGAFLLRAPAFLWTAAAFDRCLLLALVYPVLSIFVIWAITGEVGAAEQALLLETAAGWQRLLSVALLVPAAFTLWFVKVGGLRGRAWQFAPALALGLALGLAFAFTVVAFDGAFIGVGVLSFAFVAAFAGAGSVAFAFAAGSALGTIVGIVFAFGVAPTGGGGGVFALAFAVAFTVAFTVAISIAIAFASGFAVAVVQKTSIRNGWQNRFLATFAAIALGLCLAAAAYLPGPSSGWELSGPVLLFCGLLTLVNAPFDWASIGLTRFLLHLGLQLGGRWPYALALFDAALASALIVLLAMAMVFAVDLFDHLAASGGGDKARVLPPMTFYLAMLRQNPADHEFWWVYSTLFSTMIPSVINLFIAGWSFLRGFPPAKNFLLANMREGETMAPAARFVAALILTLEKALALVLAVAAQGALVWIILWRLLPDLGWGALEASEWAASWFAI
jgi:hypothetical protein